MIWLTDLHSLASSSGCDLPLDTSLTALVYSADLAAVTLGLSTGHLFLLHPPDGSLASLEEVGVLGGGVVAAAWSPDGESLAVLSGTGQLLLMTATWDLLWETSVINNAPAFPQPTATPGQEPLPGDEIQLTNEIASLSWRGDGKYLATCTEDIPGSQNSDGARIRVWDRETGELHALGEGAPGLRSVIAWQPNGRHLYAAQYRSGQNISSPSEENNGVATLSPSSKNMNEEESKAGLRGAQGQAPEVRHVGAWKRELRRREEAKQAAGTSACSNHVILFERNGLQHGGFDVPAGLSSSSEGGKEENDDVIEHLSWSPGSDILAVVLAPSKYHSKEERTPDFEHSRRTVQLWHRSNWHWYLKHERRFTDCSNLIVSWKESGGGLDLGIFTDDGRACRTTFTWTCSVSALGTAAVVDGSTVLLTPLRQCIVPPPLSAVAVQCQAPVVAVALRDCSEDEALAVVLSDGSIAVVQSVEEDLWEESLEDQLESKDWDLPGLPKLIPGVLRLPDAAQQGVVRQLAWVGPSRVLLIVSDETGDSLLEVDVSIALLDGGKSSENPNALVEESPNPTIKPALEIANLRTPGPITCCVCCASASGAIIQLESGEVWGYQQGGTLLSLLPSLHFPTACPRMVAIPSLFSLAGKQENGFGNGTATFYNDRDHDDSSLSSFNDRKYQGLGLNPTGDLWYGSHQIASGITSFIVRTRGPGGPFLLYTTRAHMLRTLPLSSVLSSLPRRGGGGITGGNNQISATTTTGHDNNNTQEYMIPEMKLQQRQYRKQYQGQTTTDDDVTLRTIEEGSLLVASPADNVDVIYQAPRGNLETARPRALVLPAVAAALDDEDFALAWRLASVDRLDLNVLADYKWPRFLGQADKFVNAIESDVDIADFIAGLSPGNVATGTGLYAAALSSLYNSNTGTPPGGAFDDSPFPPQGLLLSANAGAKADDKDKDKIVAVCEALRAAVRAMDNKETTTTSPEKELSSTKLSSKSTWLRTEVSSYSKCGDLPAALKRIKEVKEASLQAAFPSHTTTTTAGISLSGDDQQPAARAGVTAEQGLKHLLLYNFEEEVYKAALGSYELELAYMVVTHSQRDPGEYLIQLQEFAAITDLCLRRHAIDLFLERYDGAVRHLVEAGEEHFSAALELAKKQNLLRLLLQLTEGKPALRAQVHNAAGEELDTRGKHEDAALAFIAAGELEKALRAYRLAGQWRQALGLAVRLGRSKEQVTAMAARLAADLADSHRQGEAAIVTLEYLGDVSNAVSLFAEAGEWQESLRVALARYRIDLIESTIKPAAALAASRILENVQEDAGRVEKYWTRLKELRQRRAAMSAAVVTAGYEGDNAGFGGGRERDDDMESDAASMISGMSMYTDATMTAIGGGSRQSSASVTTVGGKRSKAKKQSKKNKSNKIRQGSPEEESQLGKHLLSLAPLPSVCAETGQLTETLVILGHEDDAAKLQRSLKAFIDVHEAAIDDLVANPPPGMGLEVGRGSIERAFVVGGRTAVVALEAAAAELAGAELQRKAVESEAAMKGSDWKWEILRDP